MNKILLVAVAALPLFAVAPAYAMKGIDAARLCDAQPKRCTALFDQGGGVTILIDDKIISCASGQAECQIQDMRFGVGTRTITGGFATTLAR
jgi:hypothetical protein